VDLIRGAQVADGDGGLNPFAMAALLSAFVT
jgi:hypothetical protein